MKEQVFPTLDIYFYSLPTGWDFVCSCVCVQVYMHNIVKHRSNQQLF